MLIKAFPKWPKDLAIVKILLSFGFCYLVENAGNHFYA